MDHKVFKFGGASVKDKTGFENVANIIRRFQHENPVVVISALGKTTNALEDIVKSWYTGKGNTRDLLQKLQKQHEDIASSLIPDATDILTEINDTLVEIDWIIEDRPEESFDYYYDQIVSIGEILSTKIMAAYLISIGLPAVWVDARDCIHTDNTYRDARILWDHTQKKTVQKMMPLIEQRKIIITQGFIGSSSENFTTTLGREGSDYTAAILSYCLDAKSMHIWKDVPGVLTADPRLFEDVLKLPRLSYKEAIEMTYYGAKVIHPKTIKPLQNKNIPLYVRPFDDPESEGTLISDVMELSYPPVIVIEPNQCLLHISSNDFSFVAEHHLSSIFALLDKHRIKVNMMRNTAISFSICTNYFPDKIKLFETELGSDFRCVTDEDLELITIRHYNDETLQAMKLYRLVLMEERLHKTIQMVVKNIPVMKRKEVD
ncbi:MAG: aspartate kinase [Saprospiraceae bacterium]|nr:aspartate kinase [Saprospiraceae bacterium]